MEHKQGLERLEDVEQLLFSDRIILSYEYVYDLLDFCQCKKHFKRWKQKFRIWQSVMKTQCPHPARGISQKEHLFCLICKNILRRNVGDGE